MLAVQRQPGANTVEVVDNIKKLLPRIPRGDSRRACNLDMAIRPLRNPSAQSVHDVEHTLFIAICLVVLVIFMFLRNLSATIIPSLALPMSIIGTFAVMALLGYSLDNLSLMALTLCVGFVVDDAIVMLENIVRHMENGEPPMQAALKGSREIGFTIISMTLVAHGGVHSGVVHERTARPIAARIRRDHCRGRAGVGFCFADADADDVQPVCAFGKGKKTWKDLQFLRAVFRPACATATTARCKSRMRHRGRDADCFARSFWWRR